MLMLQPVRWTWVMMCAVSAAKGYSSSMEHTVNPAVWQLPCWTLGGRSCQVVHPLSMLWQHQSLRVSLRSGLRRGLLLGSGLSDTGSPAPLRGYP
jgi:hypothetical protein